MSDYYGIRDKNRAATKAMLGRSGYSGAAVTPAEAAAVESRIPHVWDDQAASRGKIGSAMTALESAKGKK